VNPKQLACLLIAFCLSASPLLAHHYDTEENVPRKVLATLTSKDGVVIQWLHANTEDPRWRYWVKIKNTNAYPVLVRLASGADFPVMGLGEPPETNC
jgi:cell division inhibitor SulA